MKNIFALLILAAISAAGYYVYNSSVEERDPFLLSGIVDVSPELVKQAQMNNNTCSIIVKNEADVPVAFKRIINPQFPLQFTITKSDLLIGDIIGPVKLEVEINPHGTLGVLRPGDIIGSGDGSFEPYTKDILVLADKKIGMPKFVPNSKGDFFRTAAR